MKKLILVISVLLLLILPLFADGEGGSDTSTSGKIIAEREVKPTIWEPNGTGQSTTSGFSVTFEGSEEGVLYSDIGFSKVPTQITSSGLNKTAYDNDSVTMAKGTTAQNGTVTPYTDYSSNVDAYNYTSSVYVYWYCSFNKTKKLKLTVKPSDGSIVKCKYTEYDYINNTSKTTSNFASADSGVTLVTFADVIAVYHGNSEVIFNADVSKYPKNGVIATVILTLEES